MTLPFMLPAKGWPLWSKDIAALYASELVLNGLVQHWEVSDRCGGLRCVEQSYMSKGTVAVVTDWDWGQQRHASADSLDHSVMLELILARDRNLYIRGHHVVHCRTAARHAPPRYDAHGDTERYTFALYHIHAQHGDTNFSKFEFFKHKYQDRCALDKSVDSPLLTLSRTGQPAALVSKLYMPQAVWLRVSSHAAPLLLAGSTYPHRWWQHTTAVPLSDTCSPTCTPGGDLRNAYRTLPRATGILLPLSATPEERLSDFMLAVCVALQGHQHRAGLPPGQGLHVVAGCQHVAACAGADDAQAAGGRSSCRRRAAAAAAAAAV